MAELPRRPGPPPRDSSGPARTRTVRTTDAEEAEQIAAALHAGLSLSTWRSRRLAEAAARELASASTPERPQFRTLEEVVSYLDGLDDDARAAWLRRNAPELVAKPALLRAAVTQAWLTGDGWALSAACESFARGER